MSQAQDPVSPLGLRNNYHRPNQNWECGNLQHGCPCAHGPSVRGKCLSNSECTPIKDADTWKCTRPTFRGGACDQGPDQDGNCCQSRPPCTPRRTLRYRRKMFTVGFVTATLGFLMILLGSRPVQEVIVPGPLSAGHAELLMHQGADRCASCHPNAHHSVGDWFSRWLGMQPGPAKTQTGLCIDCHQATMNPATATFAHNQTPEQLDLRTQLVVNRPDTVLSFSDVLLKPDFDSSQPIACATCHREHHGQQVDMKTMTDMQCQSCHVQSIGHFESSHPKFTIQAGPATPHVRFDHLKHLRKHFAEKNLSFECASCHQNDATGNVQQLVGFEAACASCHEGALRLSGKKEIAFFQLPMIDSAAVKNADVDFGNWPEALDVDFDGQISGTMRALLEADPESRQGFYILGEEFNWMDLDPENSRDMKAAGMILQGMKRLLVDLSARGKEALRQRLQITYQRSLTREEMEGLSYGLSAELFRDARQRWFPNVLQEVDLQYCFPVYHDSGNQESTIEDPSASPVAGHQLFLPKTIYGRLDPKFLQDILAENPLSGQLQSHNTNANPAAKSGRESLTITDGTTTDLAVTDSAMSQETANTVNSLPTSDSHGEVLADNPLANAQIGSSVPKADSLTNPSGKPSSPLSSQSSGTIVSSIPAGKGGQILADNPLTISNSTRLPTSDVENKNQISGNLDQGQSIASANADNRSTHPPLGDSEEDQNQLAEILARLANEKVEGGGWRRNDSTFVIGYQISGHADRWLQQWIALAANEKMKIGVGQQSAISLFNHLASPDSSGNCMQCHVAVSDVPSTPVDHPDNLVADNRKPSNKIQLASAQINQKNRISAPAQLAPFRQISAKLLTESTNPRFSWKANYRDPMVRQFTNFNHRPHTMQMGSEGCQDCHQLNEPIETGAKLTDSAVEAEAQHGYAQMLLDINASAPHASDFHLMSNQHCAGCHREGGTPDQCTTCHSYHVGSRKLR